MKIKCPKCNKNAEMPLDYSMVKCGSCDHVWFYKIEDNNVEPLPLLDDFADKEIKDEIDNKIVDNTNEPNDLSSQKDIDNIINKTDERITEKQKPVKNKIKKNNSSKFLSGCITNVGRQDVCSEISIQCFSHYMFMVVI